MACGAGTDRPVAAAAVAPLQLAHGLALLPHRTRLLALQHVRRRTAPVNPHQLEAGGAEALKDLLLSFTKKYFKHCSAYWFQMHPCQRVPLIKSSVL